MRFYRLFALLALLALVVTACAAPTAAPAAEAPAAAATEAPAAAAPADAAATEAPPAPVAMEATPGTIRSAFRTGCMAGPLWTTCGRRLDETVLQGLVHVLWTGDGVQALLAESWEANEDSTIWTINLRQGVTWHDGEPFTADDVLYTFNTYADPAVASVYAAKLIDILGYQEFRDGAATELAGVTKIDDNTVQVELVGPRPLWMDLQAIAITILPEHILGDVPADQLQQHTYWTENRVGTGPFVWKTYVADQYVEVVANPDYFLGAPKAERIIYQIYADIPSIMNALEAGEVDIMSYEGGGVPVSELERLQGVDFLTVLPDMDAGLPTYLQFNHAQEWLQDANVRRAMVMAIDRQTIIDTIKKGTGTIANTMFVAEWTHPEGMNPNAYDPEAAKALLDEAGWDSSRQIDFIYYYADQVNKDTVTAIQAYLAQVGVNIVPRLLNPAEIQAVYADGSFEMGYFANGQGLDPSLGALTTRCGTQVALGWCNERVDELFDLGLSVASREERAPFYQEISMILNEEMPRGWLWWEVRPLAFNNRVVGPAQYFSEMPNLIFDHPVYNAVETWTVAE